MIRVIVLLAVLLSGCGAVEQARNRDAVMNDPMLSADVRRAIENKQIKVGMTKNEVMASWGIPCWYCYGTRETSEGEWWEYNPFGTGRYGAGNGTYLFFDNTGTLKYWTK